MLNECKQLWASRAAQALDARLTNHVVALSVNPALAEFQHFSCLSLTDFVLIEKFLCNSFSFFIYRDIIIERKK